MRTKNMQIHKGICTHTNTHTNTCKHTQIHMHLSFFTIPPSKVVRWEPSDKKGWPSFFLDVNNWGHLCYDSHCHIWCVYLCLWVCVWWIPPHLGGSPAVPLLTRLGSILQISSCHSGLPEAHLTVRGETLATCTSTLPHLQCESVCVCVFVCASVFDTGYMYILRAEAPVFTPLT